MSFSERPPLRVTFDRRMLNGRAPLAGTPHWQDIYTYEIIGAGESLLLGFSAHLYDPFPALQLFLLNAAHSVAQRLEETRVGCRGHSNCIF